MNRKVVERSILHYTNKERRKLGLQRLSGHPTLIRMARKHSRYMARTEDYGHFEGSSQGHPVNGVGDRAREIGYSASVGENIWQTRGQYGSAWKSKFNWNSDWKLGQAAVISWMNSPGHRKNLLNPKWTEIGIGVASNRRQRTYLTQNFGDDSHSSLNSVPSILLLLGIVIVIGLIVWKVYLN